MTVSMRFSIVTISYNQAPFLRAAIESVLHQDYPDLEYILVDPGSTDGSREIIEEYRDRIDEVVYRADRGAADGLNNGFSQVTGDIFGFLNSDDVLLPNALQLVARKFAENPDVELVMGHIWIIDKNGTRMRRAYTDPFELKAFVYGACTICQQATFFRARAFRDAGGFNVARRVAWDGDLFLEMLQNSARHIILDEFLGEFRIHDSSITGARQHLDMSKAVRKVRFERVVGRSWRLRDELLRCFYLVRKYILQPRTFWERLTRGSITRPRKP